MMVDDAHASGVFGKNGRGTIDHFDVHGRVDIQVGTLSKAMGALGGYVAGSQALIDFLYHRARPFLFSTSHPPSVAATLPGARSTSSSRSRRSSIGSGTTRASSRRASRRSASTPASARARSRRSSPAKAAAAMKLSDRLFDEGVFAQGIAFPDGRARQGARAHHRHRHAHEGRAAVRAGQVQEGRTELGLSRPEV